MELVTELNALVLAEYGFRLHSNYDFPFSRYLYLHWVFHEYFILLILSMLVPDKILPHKFMLSQDLLIW